MNKKTLLLLSAALIMFVVCLFLPLSGFSSLVSFLLPYALLSFDAYREAFTEAKKGEVFNEHLLMCLATVGAFAIGEYPEAVFLMLLFQIGELFEDYAVSRTRKSIESLSELHIEKVNLLIDHSLIEKSPEEITPGQILLVKTGEKIPLDGTVTEGSGLLDCSMLTGEATPVSCECGQFVAAGSILTDGVLKIRAEKVFGESTISRILTLIETSSEKKTKSERFLSRFSAVYTPIVLLLALLTALLPPLFSFGTFSEWIRRALVFLVVSCPCALVISVPLAFFCGIGKASGRGILIKGSGVIEALSRAGTVALDKTGTLTEGKFGIRSLHPAKNVSPDELILSLAEGEYLSDHPLASPVRKNYDSLVDPAALSDFRNIPCRGVSVLANGKKILVGNEKWMRENGIVCEADDSSGNVLFVASEGRYLGKVIEGDSIKKDGSEAIALLKKRLVRRTVMLTGDRFENAERTAKEIGIDEFHADLLPADKVEKLEELIEKEKGSVLFVGDGINDAPVLARADVGIAMGALGSDAAMEASDAVIMDDSLMKIPESISISRRTLSVVRQNLVFSIAVKVIVMLLAFFGLAGMWLGSIADVGVTLLAILNAVRLLYRK